MKIHVKELGAINEGVIDLSKRLNVFCGPNGTGKTYMAYVIYGLMKSNIHYGVNYEVAKDLIEKRKINYKIDFGVLNRYRADLMERFKSEFDSLFGIGEDLANQYFHETVVSFGESDDEFRQELISSEISETITIGKIDVLLSKAIGSDVLELEILEKTISNKDIDPLNFLLYSSILATLSTNPISSTYILPVERNSIFTFSKELSIRKQEAVDHFHAMTGKDKVNKVELMFKRTTRYPLAIKDGLLIADDLAELKKHSSEYFQFAIDIENELLHGKVQITSEGELQFKSDKSPKKMLPIHMTASIIKSLSSLVIYLKHIAKKNDLIIIDEPEINLHPDNQIILTRLFAKLLNKGFRLLISTHSDYIIRELNNLIMLSSPKEEIIELRGKLNYSEDEIVNPNDVNVYYFNYPLKGNKKRVFLETIKIEDSGFSVPSIDVKISEQNKISEQLYYTLKYGRIDV